jgi:hypothetical protein
MNLINKLINKILINPAYTTNKCSQKSDFFHNNANLEFVYIYIYNDIKFVFSMNN